MRHIVVFVLVLLCASFIHPQSYTYVNSIGKFKDASAFCINSAGFIYITDASTDEVYKLDTLGSVLKYTGGYGWNQGEFDHPSSVYATPLNVYVSDKNNHRIQRFDKDLNFISQLNTRENDNPAERFGYPLGCVTSPQGDLYILDSENKRILKFDLFGNFSQNFGGYDAGIYALSNPMRLAVSPSNNIYVLDDSSKIVVYDQYGNGTGILPLVGKDIGMNIVFNNLTVNSESGVYGSVLNSDNTKLSKLNLLELNDGKKFVSSLLFNGKLYVLTEKSIMVFKSVK
jgi:uncharacterized pyridoxamine 5'-phosphate oxidase family protein